MGMLGHQPAVPSVTNEEAAAQREADEQNQEVQSLMTELCVNDLIDIKTDIERRSKVLLGIRQRLESALMGNLPASDTLPNLLMATYSAMLKTFDMVPPSTEVDANDKNNNLRSDLLDLLSRIPLTEVPRQFIAELITLCHKVLKIDAEDNGLVAQRILFDIHKHFKQALEEQTAPLFDWLIELLTLLPASMERQIAGADESVERNTRPFIPAKASGKLASEVTVMIYFLMQSYPKRVHQYGPSLVPLMVSLITMPGPNPEGLSLAARKPYTELRLVQIKMLALLLPLSRSQHMNELLTDHHAGLCNALLHMMRTAPGGYSMRKELLQCMRNMHNTPLKYSMQQRLDDFLDENVLLGNEVGGSEALRQLAYVSLAELVAGCKADSKADSKVELNSNQLRRIVSLYTRNALNALNGFSLQSTSLRLLHNIMEVLFHKRIGDSTSAEVNRELLSDILHCLVSKLDSLHQLVPRYLSELRNLEEMRQQRKAVESALLENAVEAGKAAMKAHLQKLEHEMKERVKENATPSMSEQVGDQGPRILGNDAMVINVNEVETQTEVALTSLAGNEGKETSELFEKMDLGVKGDTGLEDVNKISHGMDEQSEKIVRAEGALAFRVSPQGVGIANSKEREITELRTLLHTVISCLKNLLFIMVAYHTSRGLQVPLTFTIKPWSSKRSDVLAVSRILYYGLPAILFFSTPSPSNFDAREMLADIFTAITDGRDFADVFDRRMPFLYDLMLANSWYIKFLRYLVEGEASRKTLSNRHAIVCILRYLVTSKLEKLDNIETAEGKLTIELLECCFKALPRIQETDAMKGQHLSQQGLPTVERATLTYIMTFLRFSHLRMASGGSAAVGHTRAMKTLFLALAPTKFTEIQAAVGGSGLHARIVDTALTIMQGPAAVDSEVEELAAELVLLVPARLEHLIHILSRMMQAAVRALNGSDHSVNIALRVLDVWVEHFNPEFIERCMSAVMKPLMTALWSHIRPPPRPFGVRVAEMLGKMGGRSRRWLGELSSVEHKSIPEYGLRIVLAFPPNTSFMVPLDRCVQLAWSTMESKTADPHRRKNALQLIQICASTLSKMQLPGDLIEFSQSDLEHVSTKTMHRLISILFGENLPPEIPSALKWPNELGVKTKKQHAAERQMLKAILTAVVTSGAIDMEVEGAGAREFALSTSRHFAFLFAVGWGNTATPPPAPPSSRMDKYDVKGGIPAYVAVLKHLQPQVILDAFEEGLKHADTAARSASVDCLITFLDTLIVLGRAQSQQKLKDLDAKKDSQNSPGWDLNMEPHHNVLQELLRRTMHCCYGDTWPMRLGGIAAIKALLPRLPEQLLGRAATFLLKALFAVLRALPDNAITEAEDVANVLFEVVRLVLKMPVEKKQEHVSPAPTIATKDTAIEEQSAMDVDDDDVQTSNLANKRGKRGKRSSAQSSRKRQHRQNDEPLVHGDISMVSSNPETSVKSIEDKLEPESRRVLRLLLETMVSSKSNDAVRAAVDKGLSLFAESLSVEVGSIVYELLSLPEPSARRDGHSQSRLLVLLERRMLPVRSLIAQTNIAYAAAFALRTCPKQIELSLPSMTFVADCCTIMEADDVNPQHSILGGLTVRGQAVKADNLSKLQIACMEVLVAAIKWPAFQTSKTSDIEPFSDASKLSQQLRDRILKLFIRRLGSSTTRVVDLAAEGIQVVMTKNLVEKEVFHEALRPILVDLAVYQRINMQLLRHVHKLVDLLSGQFNVAFGQKLIEHLEKWMEPEKYIYNQAPTALSWEPGSEWEVAASMLDMFHKLPSAGKDFLESHDHRPGIVVLTIGLEEAYSHLSSTHIGKPWSPFRAPLIRFLNKYAKESVAYFLRTTDSKNRLAQQEYFDILMDIIEEPLARPLLHELKGSTKTFITILQDSSQSEDTVESQRNCIVLLAALNRLSPQWLPKEIGEELVRWWKKRESDKEMDETQSVGNRRSFHKTSVVAKLLLSHIRRNEDEVDPLMSVLSILNAGTVTDFNCLTDYLAKELPWEFSMVRKRAILWTWINSFDVDKSFKSLNFLRYLINPMVRWAVTHGQQELFDQEIVKSLVAKVFKGISTAEACDEQVQAESVQLCSVLMQYAQSYFREQRKELIQYIWGTLKQDNSAKPYAFLCVAHFFNAFRGAEDKVMLKAFINMVRTSPIDAASREAVKEAIDVILPLLDAASSDAEGGGIDRRSSLEVSMTSFNSSLYSSLSSSVTSPPMSQSSLVDGSVSHARKKPSYAAPLRKVLVEEGGTQSGTLLVILQMIVRNREIFYYSRSSFIQLIMTSLTRMGLHNQTTVENRFLAVDLASTLYWWDSKAASEMQAQADDSTPRRQFAKSGQESNFGLEPSMEQNIMNFLLRMALVSCEVRDNRDETAWRKLHAHCLEVIRDAVRNRPPTVLKFGFFDRLLQQSLHQQQPTSATDASPPLLTGLKLVNLLLEFQPENAVVCCANQIILMFEPSLCSKSRSPCDLLVETARLLYLAFPHRLTKLSNVREGAVASALRVQAKLKEALAKCLENIAESASLRPEFFCYACNCVKLVEAGIRAQPRSMDEVIPSLLKAMNRMAKDHNQQPQAGLLGIKGSTSRESPTENEYGSGSWFVYHALDCAVPSALLLSGDTRKLFLSTLVMLITGISVRNCQTDASIFFMIMELMRKWLLPPDVTGSQQGLLTSKELLVLLQRLAQVDRVQGIPTNLRKTWETGFLDLLYDVITTRKDDDFGEEVFRRVEQSLGCGLQSSDPERRKKFFNLYSERIKRNLFDRLRYIVQVQDWEYLSHTFWLKHAVALLFDCLHMGDPITLAFNSAHVPHLFDYKSDGLYSGLHGSLGQSRQIGKETMSKISSHDGKDLAAPDKLENTNPSEGGGEAEARQPMAQDDPSTAGALSSNIELPSSIHELLASHASFLLRQAESRSQTLVSCLIEQVQTDSLVAHHLWVLLFPIVWTSLQKDHQTGLAKPLIQLLSKEHHLRQAYLRPTVGQTLLDGISMSQPQPKIPAEMIKYMGRHFHAWHTAISLLESHVGLFPLDMRCFDAVCDLYTALGEDDMRCGLWQKRAGAEETKTAIALQAHGFVSDAQSMYLEMMSRGVSGGVTGVTKNEMVLWHNQYLACCMELNQWDTVAEYAKSIDNSALQLEAAAKLHDWVHLKQMVVPKAQVEDGAEFTLIKAQLQLSEMSLIDVDKLCKSALSQYVNRWWQMPESSPGTYAQLMHGFQRAVELMETWRVMMEFSAQGGPGGHYQDLKDIADTWKLRTPNEWEPIKWWSDVLTWRNQVYNMTIRQFSSLQSAAPTLHQMGYRDKAWSVNRLGHIARVHHLPDTCVHIINTLYGFNAMEVQEAFVKVQEQAKAYMMKRSEHLHGLNLLNSTNMDYFQAPHQAEMVCLKAQFLHLLNENDTANAAFSESLTLWSLCPDAWVNWGRFCDDRYMASKQEASTKQQKPDLSWLEFASTCYMQGIRLSGLEARVLVPRVLQLLMLDVNGSTVVGRSLVSQAGDLPTWVWLPWIPQLLTSLQRDDFAVARRILLACASQHPQYMFWQVRPSYGTMRDQAIKAVSSAKDRTSADQQKLGTEVPSPTMREGGTNPMKVAQPVLASQDSSSKADEEMVDAQAQTLKSEDQISPSNPQQRASSGARSMDQANSTAAPQNVSSGRPSASAVEKPMEAIAYETCKEIIEVMRGKQPLIIQTLDKLATELGTRFATIPDERLLAVIYALQMRTYRARESSGAPIPEHLLREIGSVCKACGGKDGATASPGSVAQSHTQPNRYQYEFARDLDPQSPSAPKTLGELGQRLKGWRLLMESMVDLHPLVIKLEDASDKLMEMPLEELEMPCQAPTCPDGPDTVFIERLGADIDIVRRACSSSRRFTIIGSDGQKRTFLLQHVHQQPVPPQSEERIWQLLRASNGVLSAHPESRRRGLSFYAPRTAAVLPTGRLIEDDPSSVVYIDAYETYCARYGREPDAAVLHFKAACSKSEDDDLTARREAYDYITNEMVTENVFSQYIYKTQVENSRVAWVFKRQFTLSTALSAVACYSLRLTGRSPSKMLVSKSKGELMHTELTTNYNDRLQLVDLSREKVPFRLTRNMMAFIGKQGFEGALVGAAVAAAQGLQQERSPLPSMLALILRDDILSFAQRRLQLRSIAAVSTPISAQSLESATINNLNNCMHRLEKMGPRSSVIPPTLHGGLAIANPQAGMRKLIDEAVDPNNLCQMEPLWQPWL